MGLTAHVLAIDAGNSKTDVAVIGADGTVLGTGRGGGFQPPIVGIGPAVDALAAAVRPALAQAGVDGVDHVSACLANADLPVEERELAQALEGRGWGATVEVRNDTFAILRAGVDEPRGVAVVCGAGINCVGMRPDGATARFPAIGRISGDWGGGSGLAEEALWFAARAEDGRGEPTELARTLPGHFGLDSMYALIEALHLGHIPYARRHELTPVLFSTGAVGDPVARGLVDRLGEEVVAMASVALVARPAGGGGPGGAGRQRAGGPSPGPGRTDRRAPRRTRPEGGGPGRLGSPGARCRAAGAGPHGRRPGGADRAARAVRLRGGAAGRPVAVPRGAPFAYGNRSVAPNVFMVGRRTGGPGCSGARRADRLDHAAILLIEYGGRYGIRAFLVDCGLRGHTSGQDASSPDRPGGPGRRHDRGEVT